MGAITLKVDAEDIEGILAKIEKSFNIKFEKGEFKKAKTYNDFTSIILSKINVELKGDCTPQQAFYKLRTAILVDNKIDVNSHTQLVDIFPRATRKQQIKVLEERLDIKLDILTPLMRSSALKAGEKT